MWRAKRLSESQWQAELKQAQNGPLSYRDVGCSVRDENPGGYVRLQVGFGLSGKGDVFAAARESLLRCEMYPPWAKVFGANGELQAGSILGVEAAHLGFFSSNLVRIVHFQDEAQRATGKRSFAFAVGTLHDHAAKGEELFHIQESPMGVRADILSYSKPKQLLARIGQPVMRHLQQRFLGDAEHSLRKAVAARLERNGET